MSGGEQTSTGGSGPSGPAPFFGSRWVPCPAHVSELPAEAVLPDGFRSAGVACSIKPSGKLDLGLLVCDTQSAISAARFTTSATPAAPVLLCRERCELQDVRAVLVNSGCANAATGDRGLHDASTTQEATAAALALDPRQVAVASTGLIALELPVQKMLAGIPAAVASLSAAGGGDFQQAIQTTDAFEKRANLQVRLPSGTIRLSAQCKGAGMISPRFATMLCFIETDAALEPHTADLLLGVCVKRSFDRISVDGQLSTNDMALLMCSGASGVFVADESEDELRLGEALDALLRQLAIMIVGDGEGSQRIGRVLVRGGDREAVEMVARGVANSPLVKTALKGADPNWGRLIQAVGGALAHGSHHGQVPVDLTIEGIQVCAGGSAIEYDERRLAHAVQREEVEYEVSLPGEGAETEVFFADLGHQYVTINAEYTT